MKPPPYLIIGVVCQIKEILFLHSDCQILYTEHSGSSSRRVRNASSGPKDFR